MFFTVFLSMFKGVANKVLTTSRRMRTKILLTPEDPLAITELAAVSKLYKHVMQSATRR